MSDPKTALWKVLRSAAMIAAVVPATFVAGCFNTGPQPAPPVPPPPAALEAPPAPPVPIVGVRG